jgi:hypothetical protein
MYATLSNRITTPAKTDNTLFSCPVMYAYQPISEAEKLKLKKYKSTQAKLNTETDTDTDDDDDDNSKRQPPQAPQPVPISSCSTNQCGGGSKKNSSVKEPFLALKGKTCGSQGGSCSNTELYPILNPEFNMRESIKNMILLEDHLFHIKKICADCIVKHFLLVLGFLEEGVSLDRGQQYTDVFYNTLRAVELSFSKIVTAINNKQLTPTLCNTVGQEIRQIRKPMMQEFGTFGYGTAVGV